MHINLKKILAALFLTLSAQKSSAMVLDWSGGYRFEWIEVDAPTLGSNKGRKAYGLNYLYLTPKLIAADGVNITSRFDIFNSSDAAYINSQAGQLWGLSTPSTRTAEQSPALTQTQGVSSIQVSQLYLTVNQEYGALLVGRAPYEFGLGLTHNAGKGMFDHWYDTKDVVGYKFIVNDWFFMPQVARISTPDYGQGGTITDQIYHLQYDSKEVGAKLGYIQENRKGTTGSLSTQTALPNVANIGSEINFSRSNFYFERTWATAELKFEAGFQSGETGFLNSLGETIKLGGYGMATEIYFPNKGSKHDFNLRFGMASGDDATTANVFEGYLFDRNYDVAMLLFNHRLGATNSGADLNLFNTGVIKNSTMTVKNSIDDETLSNVMYISPSTTYQWTPTLDLKNTLTYAQLMVNPINSVDFKRDLGLEWDIELIYKPSDNIRWINQVGLLFPSDAFKMSGGSSNSTYGFASKAAISF